MIKEHDSVVLMEDDRVYGLEAGDIGAVVHVYSEGEAFEVEFVTFSGRTAAVITVAADKVRAVGADEIPHVRQTVS